MKSSQYNVYFPLKGKYIVYNTLTDSIIAVDEELKTRLEMSNIEGIEPEMSQALLKCGILVSDDTDEKVMLRFQYQAAKYSSEYISVLLLPTYACNLSCHYCPNPAQPVFMNPETTQSVISFLKTLMRSAKRGVILKLYGGEPLLNPDCCFTLCEQLSSFCQRHNLPFLAAAMTNGTLLAHKKTEPLLPYLGAVHVTLDGDQVHHDTVRYYSDGKGTYQDIIEGLTLAREKNIRITVRINTTVENLDSVERVIKDLKKRKFDEYTKFEVYFGPIAPLEDCKFFEDNTRSQQFTNDIFELVPHLRKIVKTSNWKGNIRDIVLDLKSASKPEQCQYGKAYHYVIGPLGNFYTCPGFCGNPEHCIGALRNGSATFTPLYYDLHTRDVMQLECQDCEYMPVCGGGCPVRASIRTGTFESIHCGSVKELTRLRTLSYIQVTRPDLFK